MLENFIQLVQTHSPSMGDSNYTQFCLPTFFQGCEKDLQSQNTSFLGLRSPNPLLESSGLGNLTKEQQLRAEVGQLQNQVEKQGERLKAVQERLTGEQHQVTSQELKLSTMKSRIAELEGSLALSSEQSIALRRSCLAQTEKVETVRREAEQWRGDAAESFV